MEDGITGSLTEDGPGFTWAPPLDEPDHTACAAITGRWFTPAVMAQKYQRNCSEVISRSKEVAGTARQDGQAVPWLVS